MKKALLFIMVAILSATATLAQEQVQTKATKRQKILIVSLYIEISTSLVNNLTDLSGTNYDITTDFTISDPTTLLAYDQVWDIRYNSAISPEEQAAYKTFLKAGKHLFLMGENIGFMTRNDSISSFVEKMGGGDNIKVISQTGESLTIVEPFTANELDTVAFNAIGLSYSSGTGKFIAKTEDDAAGGAILWEKGTLVEAPKGVLTVVFDVDFMLGRTFDKENNDKFLKNLLLMMAGEFDEPDPVLEPIPHHALTFLVDEGIRINPAALTYALAEGSDYTFYMYMEAGNEAKQPYVTLNKQPVTIKQTQDGRGWVYRIPAVYEDQTISVVLQDPVSNLNPEAGIEIYSAGGALIIESAQPTAVMIYNITGQAVAQQRVDNRAAFTLPKGIYIVRTDKGATKAIVK